MIWYADLLFGFLLGFSLTIPPGPMNAFIATQTMVRGMGAGVITGTGAMTADLVLGTVIFAARTVLDLHSYIRAVYVIGSVVLIVLAYSSIRGTSSMSPPQAGSRTYYRALLLGITNPFQILWWLTAGLAFAYIGGIILLAGLFAAIAVWIVLFPVVLHTGTRRHPEVRRGITLASSILMVLFAGYFIYLAL